MPSIRLRFILLLLSVILVLPRHADAQPEPRTVLAVFAHADDERIVAPALARFAREGHDVHLVVATDGRKGVTDHAGIPAGDSLADVRVGEVRCAAEALGINDPILLGLEDAGLASFASLTELRDELRQIIEERRPDVILSFGPEGGTGHPDHRLVGNVVSEIVQAGQVNFDGRLYYASLPAERMATAPPARPSVTPMASRYLTARIPFTDADREAARASFACHASQYTPEQQEAINRYLDHGFEGAVRLREWHASGSEEPEFFRRSGAD